MTLTAPRIKWLALLMLVIIQLTGSCFAATLGLDAENLNASEASDTYESNSVLRDLDFSNRTLAGVLALYQRNNVSLVYSSALVDSDMVVRINPSDNSIVKRLQEALAHFNLALEYTPQLTSWQVVRAQQVNRFMRLRATNLPAAFAELDIGPYSYRANKNGEVFLPSALIDTSYPILVRYSNSDAVIINSETLATETTLYFDSPVDTKLEEVWVTASRFVVGEKNKSSRRALSAEEFNAMPLRGGDPVQVVNNLPGVASLGFSARPHIRGGEADDVLIVFDGIELIDPFHLKDFNSLLSGLNSSVVDQVEVYTGGYSVQYGRKMSGVINIATKDNDDENELNWNFITSSAKLTGASKGGVLSWVATGRRGNLQDIVELSNEDIGSPKFSDFSGKLVWKIDDGISLDIGALNIRDDIKLSLLDGDEGEVASSLYHSNYSWLRLRQVKGTFLQSLTYTAVELENNRNGYVNEPNNPDESVGNLADIRDFNIDRIQYDASYSPSEKHLFKTGAILEYANGKYNYRATASLGELAGFLGQSRQIDVAVDTSLSRIDTGAYLSYQYLPRSWFSSELGLRWDRQDMTNNSEGSIDTSTNSYSTNDSHRQFSPRINSRFQIGSDTALYMNLGRYYQVSGINDLDVTKQKTHFYPAQKSDQLILGVEYYLTSNLQWKSEIYKKKIANPTPRAESLYSSYSLLPEISADYIYLTPDSAEAFGVDTFLKYENLKGDSRWFGHTWSDTTDSFDGVNVARQWDQKHSISLGMAGRFLGLSYFAQAAWHSGWRTTSVKPVLVLGEDNLAEHRNDSEVSDFFSFDAKISKEWNKNDYSVIAYLEVYNLTRHTNAGAYELELTALDELNHFSSQRERESLLPITPIFGVSLRF